MVRLAVGLAVGMVSCVVGQRAGQSAQRRQKTRLTALRAPLEMTEQDEANMFPSGRRVRQNDGNESRHQSSRTRAWPTPKLLEPLLPSSVTTHVWAGGCCGLGHRTSRLMKLYVYAVSRKRHVVVDWGACVGTSVTNLYAALFNDFNELKAVSGVQFLNSPLCPNGGVCKGKGEWLEHGKATDCACCGVDAAATRDGRRETGGARLVATGGASSDRRTREPRERLSS